VITRPLLSLTLAIFLSPEFGFFGFVVPTFRHTPFISGLSTSAGDVGLRALCSTRQPRRTWLNVASRGAVAVKERVGGSGRRTMAVARDDVNEVSGRRSLGNIWSGMVGIGGCGLVLRLRVWRWTLEVVFAWFV